MERRWAGNAALRASMALPWRGAHACPSWNSRTFRLFVRRSVLQGCLPETKQGQGRTAARYCRFRTQDPGQDAATGTKPADLTI